MNNIITLPGSVIHPETYPNEDTKSPTKDLSFRPLTYLACPYSHADGGVRESRFEECTKAAAWLIEHKNWNVFSPITHSHPLATMGGMSGDWAKWERIDREYFGCSRRLVVLCLPGWSKSTGVTAEIRIAEAHSLPILYLEADHGRYSFVTVENAHDGTVTKLVGSDGAYEKAVERSGRPVHDCAPLSTSIPAPDETNPKDLLGMKKPPLRLVPPALIIYVSRVMGLGAARYGAFNWRLKKIRRTIYLEAAMRHILQAIDGEDTDPDSGMPHEAHAAACMGILLDALATGNLVEDRPTPGASTRLIADLTEK